MSASRIAFRVSSVTRDALLRRGLSMSVSMLGVLSVALNRDRSVVRGRKLCGRARAGRALKIILPRAVCNPCFNECAVTEDRSGSLPAMPQASAEGHLPFGNFRPWDHLTISLPS